MAHLATCQSTNKGDKRRRTIEVSATMLRDILIGQNGPKSGTHLSLNDTNSCEILSSPHVDKSRLKNRARSEDAKVKKEGTTRQIKMYPLQMIAHRRQDMPHQWD